MTEIGGGGVKGGDFKGIQRLQATPQDGDILQVTGESAICGG